MGYDTPEETFWLSSYGLGIAVAFGLLNALIWKQIDSAIAASFCLAMFLALGLVLGGENIRSLGEIAATKRIMEVATVSCLFCFVMAASSLAALTVRSALYGEEL